MNNAMKKSLTKTLVTLLGGAALIGAFSLGRASAPKYEIDVKMSVNDNAVESIERVNVRKPGNSDIVYLISGDSIGKNESAAAYAKKLEPYLRINIDRRPIEYIPE